MSGATVREVVRLLEAHYSLRIDQLSRMVGAPIEQLRAELDAFNDVDLGEHLPGISGMFRIQPAGGWPDEGPDPAPADGDIVSFEPGMQGEELGLVYTDAATLGPLLAAAEDLRSMEPDNLTLASAVDILRGTLLTNVAGRANYRVRMAAELQRAADSHQYIRLVYSGAWMPKLSERVVEPYQVMSTSRGYELDAGPLDDLEQPRTFLISRIRDFDVLEEHFEPDPRMARAVSVHREDTAVTGSADHGVMWAVRHWAERVEQDSDTTLGVRFTAHLLPPVAQRVALMSLVSGCSPGRERPVHFDDPQLAQAVREKAAALLAHHRG